MKYWLHRISHEAEVSLRQLEQGKLTIGFSDLSNPDFLDKAKSARGVGDLDLEVKKAYGELLRSRHSLWRFLRDMRVGDLVLVPGPGQYSVYVIEGEPKLLEDMDVDLGFYREVKFHEIGNEKAENISRYDYADRALTARMKIRSTNADISDLGKNIKKCLDAYRDERPLTLHSRTTTALANELLALIYSELKPVKFEALLEWYFKRIGASSVYIPPKKQRDKEGDADIIASFDRVRLTIYVQAKFHSRTSDTGDWAVQQVSEYATWDGGKDEHAVGLWVVSTCKCFTPDCVSAAKEHGVVLVNGIQFARMLLDVGLENLDV